jgi:hypothetical protein
MADANRVCGSPVLWIAGFPRPINDTQPSSHKRASPRRHPPGGGIQSWALQLQRLPPITLSPSRWVQRARASMLLLRVILAEAGIQSWAPRLPLSSQGEELVELATSFPSVSSRGAHCPGYFHLTTERPCNTARERSMRESRLNTTKLVVLADPGTHPVRDRMGPPGAHKSDCFDSRPRGSSQQPEPGIGSPRPRGRHQGLSRTALRGCGDSELGAPAPAPSTHNPLPKWMGSESPRKHASPRRHPRGSGDPELGAPAPAPSLTQPSPEVLNDLEIVGFGDAVQIIERGHRNLGGSRVMRSGANMTSEGLQLRRHRHSSLERRP